jgi:hypothetical protein
LQGDGEKLIEIVKSEKKKKYFLPGRLEQPRQGMYPLIRFHQNLSDFVGEEKFCT